MYILEFFPTSLLSEINQQQRLSNEDNSRKFYQKNNNNYMNDSGIGTKIHEIMQ